MTIPTFTADTPANELAQALDETGCLVVTDLLDSAKRDRVRDELGPLLASARVIEAENDDPTQFYPGRTRRVSALVAHSDTVGEMIMAEHSTQLCDRLLVQNSEFGYQLHVTAALEVGPGARKQILHREEDSFTFFPVPRPNLIVASMWAISDFRADNGATLLVPGSHAGSVLYWMGGALHGAGANTSNDWRYGVILTYSCGWLRQEENQYLDVPVELAQTLSPELRDMIGYKMHRALGFSTNPRAALPLD